MVDARSYFSPPLSSFKYTQPTPSPSFAAPSFQPTLTPTASMKHLLLSPLSNDTQDTQDTVFLDVNHTSISLTFSESKNNHTLNQPINETDLIERNSELVRFHRHLLQYPSSSTMAEEGDIMEEYEKFKERKSHRYQIEQANRLEKASKNRAGDEPMRRYHPINNNNNRRNHHHDESSSLTTHEMKSSSYGGCEVVIVCAADDSWRSLLMNWALSLDALNLPHYILFGM